MSDSPNKKVSVHKRSEIDPAIRRVIEAKMPILEQSVNRLALKIGVTPPEVGPLVRSERKACICTIAQFHDGSQVASLVPCIAFSTGLLEHLDAQGIEGIAAHELAHHVKRHNRIAKWMDSTAPWASAICGLAPPIIALLHLHAAAVYAVAIVGGWVFSGSIFLAKYAVERKMEYAADRFAALFLGAAESLAIGLKVLHEGKERRGVIGRLLDTHPPYEKRIAWLEKFKAEPEN